MDKKQVKKIIKQIKKNKLIENDTITEWDMYSKSYSSLEYAARYLRKNKFKLNIKISDNSQNPSYLHGYIIFYRFCYVKINP